MLGADLQALYNLSFVSGLHLRSRIDARIGYKNWLRLYNLWFRTTVYNGNAYPVLVHPAEGRIAGSVTIEARSQIARVSLIVVDISCRGLGMRRDLISRFRW